VTFLSPEEYNEMPKPHKMPLWSGTLRKYKCVSPEDTEEAHIHRSSVHGSSKHTA
jgi:hypothetical protein